MKAIILAAGKGKRVKELTKENPKCMINLFGKTILEHQINVLNKKNISDIIVVTGFKSDSITIPGLKFYKNENFATTNMVETLFCARDELSDDVIVAYGDIIYDEKVLQVLLESHEDISVVIDKNWEEIWNLRFEEPLKDAETLILDKDGNIEEIGQKPKSIEEIQGQYIGLMRFNKNGINLIKEFYDDAKKEFDSSKKNPLNEKIAFEQSYMTDFLQAIIKKGHKIKGIPINKGWLELDTYNDYEIYSDMYKKDTLKKFIKLE